MHQRNPSCGGANGFSLIELMLAMAVTLILMGISTTLLSEAFNTRSRENKRTDALADAERALTGMSREIANAGFNLTTNGIVAADSGTDANGNGTLRFRANLNKFASGASLTARQGIGVAGEDAGEDVKYFINYTANTNYLVRYDAYATVKATVLANRIDSLRFMFYDERVTYTTGTCANPVSNVLNSAGVAKSQVAPGAAKVIVIAACITLDAVGKENSPGYQPPSQVLLVSDVALRNTNLIKY